MKAIVLLAVLEGVWAIETITSVVEVTQIIEPEETILTELDPAGTTAIVPTEPEPTRDEAAIYTSSMLSKLWGEIDVQKANETAVVEPTGLSEMELQEPAKNLPQIEYEGQLPSNFLWGWASSAYQIEGAVSDGGRGPSVADAFFHRQLLGNKPNSTGDISANHYYLYKQDAVRMRDFGIPTYAMSISWSRVFPFANGSVNEEGLRHYIDEIDYLIASGIQPIVSLTHFDMPQTLQNWFGGWSNRKVIDFFVTYAETMFNVLGSKVNTWFTIDEPTQYCEAAHAGGDPIAVYRCVHNSLIAHGLAVEKFRSIVSNGRISIKQSWGYAEPYSNSTADQKAAQRYMDFTAGWMSEPLFGRHCEYPQSIIDTVGNNLPAFSRREAQLVSGSADFYAWDGYSGTVARAPNDMEECINTPTHELWPLCVETGPRLLDSGADIGAAGDIYPIRNTPIQFRKGLNWIWDTYQPNEIIVAGLGFSEPEESKKTVAQALIDDMRCDYYAQNLEALLKAVTENNVNVTGVLAWAATDTFEWANGFDTRFGLQYVDFHTCRRFFKNSAFVFRNFFHQFLPE